MTTFLLEPPISHLNATVLCSTFSTSVFPMHYVKNVVAALIFLCFSTFFPSVFVASTQNVTILHTNDVHARFLSYNHNSKPCALKDIDMNKCWGGAARRMEAVKRIRSQDENVLLLDAGDQFQGTIWYTALKWEPIAAYMNAMNYTAMAIGNHEFDDGVEILSDFLQNVAFPVVSSNIISNNSNFQRLFKKYVEIEIGTNRDVIGIIGYTTPETAEISAAGSSVKFLDEIESIREAVGELKAKGINKIIALGHSGITLDKEICEQVEGIDVVIGGHTNTFQYNGKAPSKENPEGSYPEVILRPDGTCLYAQAFAYGKYLGFLRVVFDDQGQVTDWDGNPIFLNAKNFEEDESVANLLRTYKNNITTLENVIVKKTDVALDGTENTCRLKECNVGNLVTDSMLNYLKHYLNNARLNQTSLQQNRPIFGFAFLNGGGVRGFEAEPNTDITLENLYTILPFANTLKIIRLKGQYIWQAFEHSVKNFSLANRHGKFLQISGAKVVYNLKCPNQKRVRSIRISCLTCKTDVMRELQLNQTYTLVTTSFMTKGGDAYHMIDEHATHLEVADDTDVDVLLKYIQAMPSIKIQEEGRIVFEDCPNPKCRSRSR